METTTNNSSAMECLGIQDKNCNFDAACNATCKADQEQITLHPQGGSDLRLLAMYEVNVVHSLRRASFAAAQAIKSKT